MGKDIADEIIKQLCKDILLPLGVFQKGNSRTYIDDNGYFFTVIEFQPSAYAKGTYLNVALHFLGNENEDISFDFPFGADIRVMDFVEYQNEEQFAREVTRYVQKAVTQVLFYRKLQDVAVAKSYAKKWLKRYKDNNCISKLNMFEHLDDEEVLLRIKQTRKFWRNKPSMNKMKNHETYDFY